MQKMGAASLSAWTVPTVIAKAGTIASRPIRPLAESAQRSEKNPGDRHDDDREDLFQEVRQAVDRGQGHGEKARAQNGQMEGTPMPSGGIDVGLLKGRVGLRPCRRDGCRHIGP
jgi:hypothetical protein